MKICPRCQFYNQDKNIRCFKCGWILEPVKDLRMTDLKVRRHFFALITGFVRAVFHRIGLFLFPEIPEVPHRLPYIAAGLSFLFGLGQVYNRQYKKGIIFCVGYIIGWILVIRTITAPYSNWLILLFIAYALWTYNDGFVTAIKMNGQIWTLRYTIAAYSALFFLLGFGTVVGQFFISPVFKLIRVSKSTLAPYFHRGDMVFIDCLLYKLRSPRVGDVIFYNPETLIIEIPSSIESSSYYIHERRTFETIMGLPGDVVERKSGVFYRNGEQMPSWCKPIVPDNIYNDLKFKVPDGNYLAIYSHSPGQISLGDSFGGQAPRLNSPGIILVNWDKVCLITKEQIIGRAIFIMNPPGYRRFLRPP